MQYYGEPHIADGSVYALVGILDWHSTLGRRAWLNFGNVYTTEHRVNNTPLQSRYLFLKLEDRWANVYMLLERPYSSSYPKQQWHVAYREGLAIRMVPYEDTLALDAEELNLI